jgi:hypothetical protein
MNGSVISMTMSQTMMSFMKTRLSVSTKESANRFHDLNIVFEKFPLKYCSFRLVTFDWP